MHPNWKPLERKWERWRIGPEDECLVEISDCIYLGEGPHEICICTFGRYVRLADAKGQSDYPMLIAFRPSFQEHVNEEEPAISFIRSMKNYSSGLPEKLRLWGVVSCANGPAFCAAFRSELSPVPQQRFGADESDHSSWHITNASSVVETAERILRTKEFPPFVVQPRPETGGQIRLSGENFVDQFPCYFPSADECSKPEVWRSQLKKRVTRGEQIIEPTPERIVFLEDLRCFADDLYRGQLGWTNPEKGLFQKKGSSGYFLSVRSDGGTTVDVNTFWIDFVKPDVADSVSHKILESLRGTPFDANTAIAEQWSLERSGVDSSRLKIIGRGLQEVYAFTYPSCLEHATLAGVDRYPTKIGYTAYFNGGLPRIQMQVSDWMRVELPQALLIGRCEDGRKIEAEIHRRLKGHKLRDSVGREWYASNAVELESLYRELTETTI